MARVLIPLLVLSLTVLGCQGHSTQMLAQQNEIVVWVEKSGNNAKTTPNTIVLVDPNQKVEWYSCEGDLKIEFDPGQPNRPQNPNCAPSGNKRCEMNAPGPGHKGSHKYKVILTIQGQQYIEDPVIIVDY